MSMFSIASSRSTPGLATVSSKGYRFTTTRSMSSIAFSAAWARCPGLSRRARSPPWIFGWRVFTRPSMISGKPVWAPTSVTGRPFSTSIFAVPPVERSV